MFHMISDTVVMGFVIVVLLVFIFFTYLYFVGGSFYSFGRK